MVLEAAGGATVLREVVVFQREERGFVMAIEIQVALIHAGATVLAALVATAGVFLILAHRRTVVDLAKEVEAYHAHEGRLISKILSLEGKEASEGMVRHWRGAYRKEAEEGRRPSMRGAAARKIRRRYLSLD